MSNGTIIHGRNLDFDFADQFRNMTYRAKFVRGDKYLFDAVMFAGNVGVYTGMKAGAFSISENQRNTNDTTGLFENLIMMFMGY